MGRTSQPALLATVLVLAALVLGACGPVRTPDRRPPPAADGPLHVSATGTDATEAGATVAGTPGSAPPAMPTEAAGTPGATDPGRASMPEGMAGMGEMAADAPLPGASVYHLSGTWSASDGNTRSLAALRGHPVVVVMFYGSCTSACPLLVHSAQLLEGSLSADAVAATRFVMVTIDPTNDTPARLAAYARDKGVDRPTWLFLTGSELQTRQLAAVLGVRYRASGGGMFSHSNVITLLDGDGVAAARLEGLGADTAPLARTIEAMVR